MILSDQMILSASIEKRAGELTRMIREDRVDNHGLWYAVTTGSKGRNLLFILSNYELRNRYYWTPDRRVLALAGSWPEACKLVASLFDEAQAALGSETGEGESLTGRDLWNYFSLR